MSGGLKGRHNPQLLGRKTLSRRSQRGVGKFIGKAQAHFGMLEHVIETQVFDLVFSGMDLFVAILEFRLNDKGRWITISTSRSMVRARISTLSLYIRNIAVLKIKLVLERGEIS